MTAQDQAGPDLRHFGARRIGPGTRLNDTYEIDAHLASGGMGEVYRGHNIQTGDPVAIKIVLPDFARDENILALFRKEALILNHLFHSAIVRYHCFSNDPGIARPYLAMEFVDGISLADRMAQGPMPATDARLLTARIASGLAAAHRVGVIHRDLSPDNIILPGGQVTDAKIIDFGIARSENVGGGTLLEGRFAGKYQFVSPEQLGLLGGTVTARSDIYSLGLVLAAVLRGAAFDMGETPAGAVERRRSVPDLGGIDPGLQPVIAAMLQPDPDRRPQTMSAVETLLAAPAIPEPDKSEAQTRVLPPMRPQAPTSDSGGYVYVPSHPTLFERPLDERAKPAGSGETTKTGKRRVAATLSVAALLFMLAAGGIVKYAGVLRGDGRSQDAATPESPALSVTNDTAPRETPTLAAAPIESKPAPEPKPPARAQAADADNVPAPPILPPVKIERPVPPAIDRPARPAVEPTALSDIPKSPDEVLRWLADYDAGPCIFARARSIAPSAIEIEGLGQFREGFEMLDRAFQRANRYEPQIVMNTISQRQCAVIDFLQRLAKAAPKSGETGPHIDLGGTRRLSGGQTLSGRIEAVAGSALTLVLVDDKGYVHDLGAFLQSAGDGARFSVTLHDSKGAGAVPQLLLAIASEAPLVELARQNPVRAEDFVQSITGEAIRSKQWIAASPAYFTLTP